MGRKEDNIRKAQQLMSKPDHIRNIGIAAHIDHGKTTLSDNLIAGAGMMSEELAGKQLLLDFDEQEQARGITINAANVSMVHEVKDKEHLINLIDTPGHVDFGGDVTRAMRAVDGAVVVCCAVEGVMPQTETVIRQALKEKVQPVLFINKVDRLINELKVTPEDMQQRFAKIITHVNQLISKMVPAEFKGKWKVDPADGSVAFGSAYHNWATSVPFMQKKGISFGDIYDDLTNERQKDLAKKAPLHEVLLDMVIQHLPTANVAQAYRIPHIWHGEADSKMGKAMATTDPKGAVTMMVTKIVRDPHAGEIAVGRLFSGTVTKGQEMHIIGMPKPNRVQQVGVYVGADRISVDEALAGNIVAVSGLRDAISGSTCTTDAEMEPFERIVHYSEPVVTVAVEAEHMKDLPKLVETLRAVAKADPSIHVEIDQETGEHLMSGMGELHLEITEYRITNEYGVPIKTSPPIVVYRETVKDISPRRFEGKSPNKHNRFYIETEPMPEDIAKAIREGELPVGAIRKSKEVSRSLQDMGMSKDLAKGVLFIENGCMLIDATKGIQYLYETRELLIRSFKEAVGRGPRANELMVNCIMKLVDAKLHEDAIHRGEAQVIPAVRRSIYGSAVTAGMILLEPKQKVFVSVPQDLMGNVTRELHQRRAVIEDMQQEGDMATIVGKAPIAEMFGFANAIRSTTQGRALWTTEFTGYEAVPPEMLEELTTSIRQRKGLKPEPPTAEYYGS